ncbi:MAG: hypothetical protein V8S93_13050 [Lachnospiraceae bacterium]
MKIQKKLPVLLMTAALFAGQSALTVHAAESSVRSVSRSMVPSKAVQ